LAIVVLAVTSLQAQRAGERVQQAQYCAAVERRAQHREIARVQALSELELELAAAQHAREIARLIEPAGSGADVVDNVRLVHEGGAVKAMRRVHSELPPYPPAAIAAHIGGVVKIEATVGKDGRVRMTSVLSGPPALTKVAERAVRQWRYEPATIDGLATEQATVVTLRFMGAQRDRLSGEAVGQ
jgi:TonB family protein